jgi:hypothetical protein
MTDPVRLPTHIEAGALIRRVQQEGGFATVLAKGEREAGTILLILNDKGREQQAWERMPNLDGERVWSLAKAENPDDPGAFAQWVDRRSGQDRDLWIIELDIPNAQRFISPQG